MKLAFLILAHKNPVQMQRMIRALDHPAFDFYIHLDKKADISEFSGIMQDHPRVFFVKDRVDVQWAGYSLVQAQINGMREALAGGKYDYLTVMSAQDFPLRSPEFIYNFFKENKGTEYISCETYSPDNEWWKVALPRVSKYHFQNFRFRGKYRLQFLINWLTRPRRYPLDHTIAGRSQWFSITGKSAAYMVQFLDDHPEVPRYFRYVWGADEFIFSTVIYNSPFRKHIKDHLFYIDWSERKSNPKLLRMEDLDPMMKSNKLFARKFDLDVDTKVVEKLEEMIGARVESGGWRA